ncbi:hypothetical protein F4810DRAFT_716266 [Camillea tinctor]|nr:hypothetical protein F4810DRAFT_716266 [Camillea tinctor]
MRFHIPSTVANACVLSWRPPPESSARSKDITTKGGIIEIEVSKHIAPSATLTTVSSSMDVLDYDTLSYLTLPVTGVRMSQRIGESSDEDDVPARGVSRVLHANRNGAKGWI